MKVISNLDINGNKVQNLVIESLPSDPENPVVGLMYFNTTTDTFRYYSVDGWEDMGEKDQLQEKLVSGENIKTINSESLLGEGDIVLPINVRVGSKAEREAFTAFNGLQWNEIDSVTGQITQYIYENNHWLLIHDVNEHFIVSFSSATGLIDFSNYKVTIKINGEPDMQLNIDSNYEAELTLPYGYTYTVVFPTIPGYMRLQTLTYLAGRPERHIYRNYIELSSDTRAVVMERSNPENWETSGPIEVVQDLLNVYGSYVIDEVHGKYAQLSPTDHSKFVDGTKWSGEYGDAFRRLPRIYYKVETNEIDEPLLKISYRDIGGHYWEEDWTGIYKGSVVNSKLRSRPGLTTTQSMTMSAFWTAAQQVGSDYGLVNYFNFCKLNALHLARYGCANSEKTMGPGLQNAGSGYYAHQTGTTASIGDATGQVKYQGTSYYMNKLFGIEDLAGGTWEFRPNIRFDQSGSRAVIYEGNIVSNTATGVRTFSKLASASGAYVTKMALGEYCDFIPTAVGGSSGTYYCDGTWASSSGQLLIVGGSSGSGTIAGLSCSNSSDVFSFSYAHIGARLSFLGDITALEAVSGATLAALNAQ